MAIFIGTSREYLDFIGPRIRNIVQRITSNDKKKCNNICAHCKQEKIELEAAHIHGKERKKIIETILAKYKKENSYLIDIGIVEKEIIQAHYPITENFIFLCRPCHKIYDSQYQESELFDELNNENEINFPVTITPIKNITQNDLEFLKVQNRLPNWFKKKDQYNSRILYAFLRLYDINEIVSYEELKNEAHFNTFKSNFDQMKNFGEKNHGKIFEQIDSNVYLWDYVKELVLDTYEKYR